jgi:SRSO17 transposase
MEPLRMIPHVGSSQEMGVPGCADAALLSRLLAYLNPFRDDFRRRDRVRCAQWYLVGLLLPSGRKNVEGLARQVAPLIARPIADVAQALQNLIGSSPWEADAVWQRYRALLVRQFADPEGIVVIDDLVFPKQGNQSVGVQRQFSTELGRKLNCQIAVALHYVGSGVSFPLAIQLYLPNRWLHATSQLDAAGVPEDRRIHRTRAQIALDLLDALQGEQLEWRYVVAGLSYRRSREFRQGLVERDFLSLSEVPGEFAADLRPPIRPAEPLSLFRLDPASVAAEAMDCLLVDSLAASVRYAVGRLEHTDEARAWQIWQSREVAQATVQRLKDGLGLDQFEGRSWRGFHHHACLVALAHAFQSLQSTAESSLEDCLANDLACLT